MEYKIYSMKLSFTNETYLKSISKEKIIRVKKV